MITDDDIQNLISLPKRIVVRRQTRGYREENGARVATWTYSLQTVSAGAFRCLSVNT